MSTTTKMPDRGLRGAMDAARVFAFAVLLVTAFAAGPLVGSASAHHSCVDDVPCYPHVEELSPKPLIQKIGDKVRCLILAQPPTACL